jgi:pimeloyl-ACP methyl ester carboxylesterase
METKREFHFIYPTIEPREMSNLNDCIDFLANLIQRETKNSRVHIVGLSIGVHLAVHLAQRYPQLVLTLNISGYNGFSGITQQLLPAGIRLLSHLSAEPPLSHSESHGVANTLLLSPKVEPLPMRTLILVGLCPTLFHKSNDDPKVAKELQRALSGNQSEVVVKSGRLMKHRWNVGHPDLYAKVILAWIDNSWSEDLEEEFEDL